VTSIDQAMSFAYVMKLQVLQSLGLAFLFVPINTLIDVGVPPGNNNDVSGLSNLARNIGGSPRTCFFTTILARHQQVHQQYLAQHVYDSSQAYLQKAGSLSQQFLTRTAALTEAHSKAMLSLYQSVQAQASGLCLVGRQ
jgi:MFS transporter, DHA2 family, multidrug resistance protein